MHIVELNKKTQQALHSPKTGSDQKGLELVAPAAIKNSEGCLINLKTRAGNNSTAMLATY